MKNPKTTDLELPFDHCHYCTAFEAETERYQIGYIGGGCASVTVHTTCEHRDICIQHDDARHALDEAKAFDESILEKERINEQ